MKIKSAWEILQSKHAFSVEGRYDSFEYVITTDDAIEMAKEYAAQFIDLAARLGNEWENSGELSQEILKIKEQIK